MRYDIVYQNGHCGARTEPYILGVYEFDSVKEIVSFLESLNRKRVAHDKGCPYCGHDGLHNPVWAVRNPSMKDCLKAYEEGDDDEEFPEWPEVIF